MKILILGKEGLLGTSLQALCAERGISYVGASKQEANICSYEDLKRAVEKSMPTHIVNCAAYTNVDGAEKEQDLAYLVNVEGARNVGKVARDFGIKALHLSSDYVFDGKGSRPYVESDVCQPLSVYAKTKREGEIAYLEENPVGCLLRTSWVFGVLGKNFISSLLKLMQSKEELQVVSDQRGRPSYCKDVAGAILALLDHSGIFHFANGQDRSRYEMAQDVLEETKRQGLSVLCKRIAPVPSLHFPTPAPRPSYSVLSTKKFEEVTGLYPRSWKEVLQEHIADVAKR